MNELNKITEVDLNPELAQKINKNHSNMVEIVLSSSNWTALDGSGYNTPEEIKYMYIHALPVVNSSMVDAVFDNTSKELALDCGVYDLIKVLDGSIIFFSEEIPQEDLNVTVHYII